MNSPTLDQKLIQIGFQISSNDLNVNLVNCDLEYAIHQACLEVPNDSRLFSLICSWVSVHGDYIIIEKLMKLQKKQNSQWLVAVAICASNMGFHQWKRLIKKQKNENALVDIELAKSSISIKGAEENFKKFGFLIPKNGIRIRSSDVLTTERLVQKNLQYRNRLLFGASWRADIITAIQMGMKTPYEISKKIGCSYEPAYRIFKEYALAVG